MLFYYNNISKLKCSDHKTHMWCTESPHSTLKYVGI